MPRSSQAYRQLADAVEENMISFYSIAYRYQIRVILQYGRKKALQLLRNAVGADDWKSTLEEAETITRFIDEAINNIFVHDNRKKLGAIDDKINSKAQEIIDMQQKTLDHVVVSPIYSGEGIIERN